MLIEIARSSDFGLHPEHLVILHLRSTEILEDRSKESER